MRKNTVRGYYEFLHEVKGWIKDQELTDREAQKLIRHIRDEIKIADRGTDPLAVSMMEDWRHHCGPEWDSGGNDYMIFEDHGESDEEIKEFIEEEVELPPIHEEYSPTGKYFTWDVHWSRTPAGIVIIHRWHIDV